ncbi:hypothetical protein D3C80_2191390 [compost metagenome]
MIKNKKLSECTEVEYKAQVLYLAKQSFDLRIKNGVSAEETFTDLIEYVYNQAHNRGTYDARLTSPPTL